jgi:PKHD-type hydroxylase
MPRASFFTALGLYVVPRFFDRDLCASLRAEMRACASYPASVRDPYNQNRVDEDQRRTEMALVSPRTQGMVMARLTALEPSLEQHFGVSITGCQPLNFLIYKEGYYFIRHADSSDDPDAQVTVRERVVSISLFLNGEGDVDEPETYSGGSLAFYGAVKNDPHAKRLPFPLTGEEGLLVAFRSDAFHAVQPITRGVRYSVVAWFTGNRHRIASPSAERVGAT